MAQKSARDMLRSIPGFAEGGPAGESLEEMQKRLEAQRSSLSNLEAQKSAYDQYQAAIEGDKIRQENYANLLADIEENPWKDIDQSRYSVQRIIRAPTMVDFGGKSYVAEAPKTRAQWGIIYPGSMEILPEEYRLVGNTLQQRRVAGPAPTPTELQRPDFSLDAYQRAQADLEALQKAYAERLIAPTPEPAPPPPPPPPPPAPVPAPAPAPAPPPQNLTPAPLPIEVTPPVYTEPELPPEVRAPEEPAARVSRTPITMRAAQAAANLTPGVGVDLGFGYFDRLGNYIPAAKIVPLEEEATQDKANISIGDIVKPTEARDSILSNLGSTTVQSPIPIADIPSVYNLQPMNPMGDLSLPQNRNLMPQGVDLSQGYMDRLGNFIAAPSLQPVGIGTTPVYGYKDGGSVDSFIRRASSRDGALPMTKAKSMLSRFAEGGEAKREFATYGDLQAAIREDLTQQAMKQLEDPYAKQIGGLMYGNTLYQTPEGYVNRVMQDAFTKEALEGRFFKSLDHDMFKGSGGEFGAAPGTSGGFIAGLDLSKYRYTGITPEQEQAAQRAQQEEVARRAAQEAQAIAERAAQVPVTPTAEPAPPPPPRPAPVSAPVSRPTFVQSPAQNLTPVAPPISITPPTYTSPASAPAVRPATEIPVSDIVTPGSFFGTTLQAEATRMPEQAVKQDVYRLQPEAPLGNLSLPINQNLTPQGVDLSQGYTDRLGNFIAAPNLQPVGIGTTPVFGYKEGGEVDAFIKRANGGSSSSGVRRLKMSGYQEGGEVTDEAFIQEMMTGTPASDEKLQSVGEYLKGAYKENIPVHARVYLETLLGKKGPVTAEDFTKEELADIEKLLESKPAKGAVTKYAEYEKVRDLDGAGRVPGDWMENLPSVGKTLGRFTYETLPDGKRVITDNYDFYNTSRALDIQEFEGMKPAEKALAVLKKITADRSVMDPPFLKRAADILGEAYIGRDGRPVKVEYDPKDLPVKREAGSPPQGEISNDEFIKSLGDRSRSDLATIKEAIAEIGKNKDKYVFLESRGFTPTDIEDPVKNAAYGLFLTSKTSEDPQRFLSTLSPFYDSKIEFDYTTDRSTLGEVQPYSTEARVYTTDDRGVALHELVHTLQMRRAKDIAEGKKEINQPMSRIVGDKVFQRASDLAKKGEITFPATNWKQDKGELMANVYDMSRKYEEAGKDFTKSIEFKKLFPDEESQLYYYTQILPDTSVVYPAGSSFEPLKTRDKSKSYARQLLGFAAGGEITKFIKDKR